MDFDCAAAVAAAAAAAAAVAPAPAVILPYVPPPQLQRLADQSRGPQLRAGDLAGSNAEHALALQTVEVLGEAAAVGEEIVALDEKHEQGVSQVEVVQEADEVAGVPVSGEDQKVAEGRGEEGGELLLGE
ncbi:hypothetical protein GP486_008631 [Trichoglossum hirsutum]|uniref:Uncharacterized protein n=1 Tax=Trichoglossum hirsutum TaxID=265104 RepID=A0A9P8I526_9PEZI|nr:hypothetical protein GP486_008631 [Trichoglossum hirsutum]